ncbi:MAG: hypothetical protein ACRC7C_08510 [Beijerinckiaceae bacterium]
MRATIFLTLVFAFAGAAAASDNRPVVSGEEMRRILSGNTMSGRHDTGMPFSEWHAPDGRVFGHNNHEAVDRGCWDIRGDSVCYYYSGGTVRGAFCWTFRRVTDNGFALRSVENGLNAVGILTDGNTYTHTDNEKPWTCEPLSSQKMTPRGDRTVREASLDPRARHARR